MPLNYLWKFHKQDDVHDFTSIECQHLKTDQSSFELQRMTVIMRASWLDRFSRVSMPASRRVLLFLSHIICSIKTKLVHRRRLATCHCYSFWLWTAYFILREVNKIVLWTEKKHAGMELTPRLPSQNYHIVKRRWSAESHWERGESLKQRDGFSVIAWLSGKLATEFG